jgi:hypothetical protein
MSYVSNRLSALKSFLEGFNTDQVKPPSESILNTMNSELTILFFIVEGAEQGKPFPTGYPHREVLRSLQKDLATLQSHFNALEETRLKVLELKGYFVELEDCV